MVQLSQSAAGEILRLRAKRQNNQLLLRLGVQKTGCMGLSYSMEFSEAVQVSDRLFICGEVQIVVDPESLKYFNGLTLDYSEDLMGGGFRFSNPNVSQSCGCGNSFAVSQEDSWELSPSS
jgi:iron-sulfur cluster assembly protein